MILRDIVIGLLFLQYRFVFNVFDRFILQQSFPIIVGIGGCIDGIVNQRLEKVVVAEYVVAVIVYGVVAVVGVIYGVVIAVAVVIYGVIMAIVVVVTSVMVAIDAIDDGLVVVAAVDAIHDALVVVVLWWSHDVCCTGIVLWFIHALSNVP